MPIQFSCTTSYLGEEITVTGDDFSEVHEAIARINELNGDANYLAKKSGSKNLVPDYRTDQDGNEYYGVSVKGSRESVTFGQLREGGLVPFFPKGDDGHYDPSERNDRRSSGGGQKQQEKQNGQRKKKRQPAGKQGAAPDDGLPF